MEDSIPTYSRPSNKLESWKKTITRKSLHISLREREREREMVCGLEINYCWVYNLFHNLPNSC